MQVTTIECGRMACNNYLVINDETNECVLIDCSSTEVLLAAQREGLTIKAILLTHGHADHIEALDAVAVRPTSMQTVVLTGPELDMEICADELESLKLFPGENCLELADEQGGRLGTLQRIYIPIDE